ncbi:MAG: carboxylating nicotinate-nucleotide diphosphorylase [Candidatus Rifleibacteriota bacterium]
MELEKIISESVKIALNEDLQGQKDITSLMIPETRKAKALVITREDMILAGQAWVNKVFSSLDPEVKIEWNYEDGDDIEADCLIFTVAGKARALLTAERTALNFLQTLSGVATVTRQFVNKMGNSSTQLLDTRKTVPGLRMAQKYAVSCGGGTNHRIGLFDAFLIKENHINACGSITETVKAARNIDRNKSIEVEVESLMELREALQAGADIIMLDNFSVEDITKAVEINSGKSKLEVSGDVGLHNIAELAATGVDYISSGSLTKHVRAINLSMRFDLRVE